VHYYKFNISDWTLHTAHLTVEEEGVYFRLVNYYYDTEQPIPEKTQWVIRRLRLCNNSDLVGLILEEYFSLEDGFWHHKRCDSEIELYQAQVNKNRLNGNKGGRPKGSVDKAKRAKKPKTTQVVNSENPNVTLTTNQEPLTTNHSKYKKLAIHDIPDSLVNPVMEFIDHRINLKKPLTQEALSRFMAAACSASSELSIPIDRVISETIDAGWQSVKTDWLQNRLGASNAQIRSGGNPAQNQRKPTPAERTEAKREAIRQRELGEQPPSVGSLVAFQ
jgi:uncharacterized protein YdaU (DUF1376 family)